MGRAPIPTWFYALVVIRRGLQFLVVQEPSHGCRWYLPAGRVEPGETLMEAAQREAFEEAGIPIVLDGILQVQHTPIASGTRVRVIFVGHAADDRPPKNSPDRESLGAAWVTLDELRKLPLRGQEVLDIFQAVLLNAPIYPLSLLGHEE